MHGLIRKAKERHELTASELQELLGDSSCEEELAKAADEVRRDFVGDGIHLRGLIEFSNICRQNCMYCGLRRENGKVERSRLQPREIVRLAEKARNLGYRTVVLQSGEDAFFSTDVLVPVLQEIHEMDLAITLSIGERSYEEYRVLREAGADRFLLRIETTDRELYEKLDPGMSHENRMRCLRDLKELGYEVGSGSLVGLPGQSTASLAEDILYFKRMDLDMIGIGPLIPNEDTPLGGAAPGDFHLTRRMVSLLRLLLPEANIPATTAMETLVPGGRNVILTSGANVFMPNMTEGEQRRKYALYPGKSQVADRPVDCVEKSIAALGRFVARDQGFRKKRGEGDGEAVRLH